MHTGFKLVMFVSCAVLVRSAPKFKAKPLPNYISPCKIDDPDLSKCALSHAKQAMPTILKGDPAYKVRNLDPFHLEEANISPNKDLSLILTNVDFSGMDHLELLDMNFDLKKKHISAKIHADLLTITGKYDVSGQILVVPIKGNGPLKLDFEDCNFVYSFDYDVITQEDGNQYMSNIRPNIEAEIGNARYRLDNLFDGNKELGDNVNKVLNENSKEVLGEFGVVVKEIVNVVALEPLRAYLTTIPLNVLFSQ
ncbi:protein takeout-like [Euwallacea fornicatus]|uniref:protein takeout-like n=1 Tax=Euwallacea fornicatus TaxID=995702 RepID=UPI00338F6818